jgi:DNA polymerase-3 subunit alpha
MQIAQVIAGFSLGKADVLRKAVSKKNAKTMAEMKEAFIQGSLKQGYSLKIATQIYDLIEKFANYGFNKSHSVAYAFVAYQLAYLKVHAPLYFFASILSNEGASANTKIHCIEEAKRYHVKILPPSINRSLNRFTVEEGGIRFALTSIKNVGYSGYKDIAKEREEHGPFHDFVDFLGRMSGRLNSKMIDSLISAGAFDDFGMSRAMLKGDSWYEVALERLKAKDPHALGNDAIEGIEPDPEKRKKILFDVASMWDVFDVRFASMNKTKGGNADGTEEAEQAVAEEGGKEE